MLTSLSRGVKDLIFFLGGGGGGGVEEEKKVKVSLGACQLRSL